MTFLELAEEVLKTAKEPLTYREIWEIAISQGLDKKVGSKGKTPTDTLSSRIYTDLKEKSDSKFCITSKRPTTFWLKSREDEVKNIIIQASTIPKVPTKIVSFHERDLHPLLVKFLFESEEFDLYCKTIYHENSKKGEKGKDKWNYPDIVGIHFPFDDYKKETLGLLKNLNKQSCKIYSFEIKKSITWSDIKEYYFQAVSNSSWANEGYLVVFENIEADIFSELIRLNASFGIGIIQLEIDSSSKVILPARQRNLDMQTLDMLVEKNKNFKDFIDDVNKDINANDKFRIAKDRYDKILNDDELEKYIEDKKISK
ncbi:HTH domain-containing protein [Brachyspira catarrhinii]|uniref:HrgA protein n=1 Tax=Brachyspira catarrhinii TaxID=2528966 RepID=A0ABY2TS21_9SPIR|nr:HTH domain-containing protein [Brachyspira catarrhinii]TKZ35690.1 HrgA protein [Brachyspira catarrhinii]